MLALLLLCTVLAGCSSATAHTRSSTSAGAPTATAPAFCRQQHPAVDCVVAEHGRFTVAITTPLSAAARKVGVAIGADLTRSLHRIAALLPGPHTDILLYASAKGTFTGLHVGGYTAPNGQVDIPVDTRQSPPALRTTLRRWLRVALSHETDHSVRAQAGPGLGPTLLDLVISEGMSSAFDLEVQPDIRLPWTHALGRQQERRLWAHMRPLLGQVGGTTGLYHHWFFGAAGIPPGTGFQIGYHIVRDYLTRHPRRTAASLVDEQATEIFAGSHYRP